MTKIIQINPDRLDYLLSTHGVTKQWLLEKLNEGRKKLLDEDDVFSVNVKVSVLRQVDAWFSKGLSFYTDPSSIEEIKKSSIFFRKKDLNGKLEFGDRWRILQIEDEIAHMGALMTLSKFKPKRKIKRCTMAKSPQRAAAEMREIMPLKPTANDRDFLKQFIGVLSQHNILVYEFIEPKTQKEKVSWEGVFLAPHTIALKRLQRAFKREIFTLAHELGHYLLDKEDVDTDLLNLHGHKQELKKIESWCNTFAFHFLVGDASESLPALFAADKTIHNHHILELSKTHKISRLAIYTHLLQKKHIKWNLYKKLKNDLEEYYPTSKTPHKQKKERQKLFKRKISVTKPKPANTQSPSKLSGGKPKPIFAPLMKDIYRYAFFNGVIEDIDIVNQFNPNQSEIENGYIDNFLSGEQS